MKVFALTELNVMEGNYIKYAKNLGLVSSLHCSPFLIYTSRSANRV